MAYTPTNWQNGDVITAEKLNKLENGVAQGGSADYDLVLIQTDSDNDDPTLTGHGISLDDVLARVADGEEISFKFVYIDSSGYVTVCPGISFKCTDGNTVHINGYMDTYIAELLNYYHDGDSSSLKIKGPYLWEFTYDSDTKDYTFTYQGEL